MNPKNGRLPGSKWIKWQLVDSVPELRSCQPETAPYTPEGLAEYLTRYSHVFVKPDNSYGGRHVIRVHLERPAPPNLPPVSELSDQSLDPETDLDSNHDHDPIPTLTFDQDSVPLETIVALLDQDEHRFPDTAAFDTWLRERCGTHPFLIQQGIDLTPLNGQVVDLRTIAQCDKRGRWEITGYFAKQAPFGMAVTNVKAGGTILPVPTYLQEIGIEGESGERLLRELKSLSLEIVELFSEHYRNVLYGLDIGLDRDGKLWLIEINTRPSVLILRDISHSMYRRAAKLRWPNRF